MSLGVAWLIRHRGVPNGYSTVSSYQVPTSSKYYSTPTSFFGEFWLFFTYAAYGSANAYSKGIHYKVPSSWKYYLTPTSFLASIGVSLHLWHIGVQILILRGFITKCQVVGNII